MTTERTCLSCQHFAEGRHLDDVPQVCWNCAAGRYPNLLPNWKPMSKSFDAAFRTDDAAPNLPPPVIKDTQIKKDSTTPLDTQVGGTHYKDMKIQPIEFCMVNELDACQSKVIKYVTRRKGDQAKRLEDLDKAIHILQLYKQLITDGKAI